MKMNLTINDYTYDLPPDRIARYPLEKRDESRLLIYNKGEIRHAYFNTLSEFIPANSLLFFNNTKVIPARLRFTKDTGAVIELFLLTPVAPSPLMAEAMLARHTCSWKCTIGNSKRWSSDKTLLETVGETVLEASLVNREEGIVEFTWTGSQPFGELVNEIGNTPLPPYLKREAEAADKNRYQTIYSRHEGAVAAPTAGLHFTETIFDSLLAKGITKDFVTLHVSAGTFQPVKVENALEHRMHTEQLVITRQNIENLLRDDRVVVPVGTTSMRVLESIYWYGVKVLTNKDALFYISQTDPYQHTGDLPTANESIRAILNFMNEKKLDQLTGYSAIYIHPGYTFKVCDALITNFHQPGSTLILLVAAFAGDDWRKIYQQALDNNYRFLSYGDSSLIIP
jgi:S-adenosylmethionine:tRNA ribosyltransferase-isomerase